MERYVEGEDRALLMGEDPITRAENIMARGLNVRDTEKLIKLQKEPAANRRPGAASNSKDTDTVALEHRIINQLGLAVDIKQKGEGCELTITYRNINQLDQLIEVLSQRYVS